MVTTVLYSEGDQTSRRGEELDCGTSSAHDGINVSLAERNRGYVVGDNKGVMCEKKGYRSIV